MRRDVNFDNSIVKIVRKGKKEEREMMWRKNEREKVISTMVILKY